MNLRDKTGPGPREILVEGRLSVARLLQGSSLEPLEVVLQAGLHPDLVSLCHARGVVCREVAGPDLRPDPAYRFHRGACATARRPEPSVPDEAFLARASRLLVPVDFADAGNLGTLLRSARAFGIDGIVMEKGRGVDVYSRKSIRGSAGAVFQMPVFEVASLGHTLERLSEAGFVLLGTGEGPSSRPLGDVRAARKTAIVIGSDPSGLPPEIDRQCAELVHLPKREADDSHNIAVTGAILMWEWFGRVG